MTTILDSLNNAQKEAVTSKQQQVLVLAGAGSGKTRVLTHRIAWLVQTHDLSPHAILAVTFTNKAANEMKSRIETLLERSVKTLWVGTFHGLAHRLLRLHWQEAHLPQAFQIMDQEDQLRLIRRIMRERQLIDTEDTPQAIQSYINRLKDDGLRIRDLPSLVESTDQIKKEVYQIYEAFCEKNGLVDFAELLLRAHELWRDCPEILTHYQNRFQHILVDEFQDTNQIQYHWIQMLASQNNQMTIVGDDDQSIYSWRGARAAHLARFQQDFPQVEIIRLEENYRSTPVILKAANHLISHNTNRLGKTLWTQRQDEEKIGVYNAYNEYDEADFVVKELRKWIHQGYRLQECAILYRSNAQSRNLETALLKFNLPYRIYGGFKFFERAEVKDVLAYLRLVINHDDDVAFERIINVPTRGLGTMTIAALRQRAREQGSSLWRAAQSVVQQEQGTTRVRQILFQFIQLIEILTVQTTPLTLTQQLEHIIHGSGLAEYYKKEPKEQSLARLENLEELLNAAQEFEHTQEETHLTALDFLAQSTLESIDVQDGTQQDQNRVQLMTLHAAKGLEFPLVFIVGLEEGLFPHQMSFKAPTGLEEERRLCYVGMTRAMKKLYLLYANNRRLHGQTSPQEPSRFLAEIPHSCLEEMECGLQVSRPHYRSTKDFSADFSSRSTASFSKSRHHYPNNGRTTQSKTLGRRVSHPTFGEGIILKIQPEDDGTLVQVNFERSGIKWLMLEKAHLTYL